MRPILRFLVAREKSESFHQLQCKLKTAAFIDIEPAVATAISTVMRRRLAITEEADNATL
jgi:hypothetical protein